MELGRLLRWTRYLVIGPVRLYQLTLSPYIGWCCRYTPSCSNYMLQAVERYGLLKGTAKGVWRICRCHPFARGGYDPVEQEERGPKPEDHRP